MITFWVICGLLILVALIIVLPSLLSKEAPKDIDRKKINRAVFEKKLQELENDRNNDLIDEAQYEIAKTDLERSLIDDIEKQEDIVLKTENKILPIIIVIALPIAAVVTYLQINNGLQSLDPEFQKQMTAQQSSGQMGSVEEAIAQLEARLKVEPENVEGWQMLGRSYLVTKRFDDAATAYAKANEISNGANPNVLISYGEALGFAAGNQFDSQIAALFEKALTIDPDNERGLWYAGMAAFQLNDYQTSIKHWEKLIQTVPDDQADVKSALLKYLNDAKQKAGIEIVESQETLQVEPNNQANQVNQSKITVNVMLSDALLKKTVNSDTLFIYARAVNGPKVPLALVKLTAEDLPTTVTLDDSVSMMPSMTLSSMEQVEVIARISKSGQAIMQSGDFFGSVKPVNTGQSETIDVVISELAP